MFMNLRLKLLLDRAMLRVEDIGARSQVGVLEKEWFICLPHSTPPFLDLRLWRR